MEARLGCLGIGSVVYSPIQNVMRLGMHFDTTRRRARQGDSMLEKDPVTAKYFVIEHPLQMVLNMCLVRLECMHGAPLLEKSRESHAKRRIRV